MKEFLDFYTVRNNALLMAERILKEGFYPDVLYMLLRGGSVLGNVISEYFRVAGNPDKPVFVAAVAAKSYTGVAQRETAVKIEGWTLDPRQLSPDSKILLTDDIFDSGRTLNRIARELLEGGIRRENLKIAVHDYKIKHYDPQQTALPIRPDFYARRFEISRPEEEIWIHYLSHELVGLTEEEFRREYRERYPELKDFSLQHN